MPTTLYFMPSAALTFVRGSDSQLHAHRAVQLTLALDGMPRVRRDVGDWGPLEFEHFGPEHAHRIDSSDALLAHLFVDPGPRAHAAWLAAGHAPRAPGAALTGELRALANGPRDAEGAARLAARWQQDSLPGWHAAAVDPDPRIAASLARVEADPSIATNHRELAAAAHLSPSRYADRFRAATGMPVRNYLLWRRLLLAVERLQRGESVTQAAHDSGFSDAAHLSRSFRRILGAMPSDLL